MDSAARLRVVVVDDNEEWRQILTRLLQPVYDVIGHIERGDEVLDLVSQLHPDIITMDVSLPHLSGLNALPAVRAALPHAAIVIVSTTATPWASGTAFHEAAPLCQRKCSNSGSVFCFASV